MTSRNGDGDGNGAARGTELLWVRRERGVRGPKPVLSTERIVQVAIRVADAEGLSAVSMQRVAREFGFSTMSLYRYVPGKTEMVGLMIDTALGEPPVLDGIDGGWRPKIEEWARRMRSVLARHPWSLWTTGLGRVVGPNELGWLESGVHALDDTGLTGAERADAVVVVGGQVRSWARYSAERADDEGGSVVGDLVRAHRDRFPALMAALSSGALSTGGPDFGLGCVLDGIGARIAERAT